jgi:hypothetical protein
MRLSRPLTGQAVNECVRRTSYPSHSVGPASVSSQDSVVSRMPEK